MKKHLLILLVVLCLITCFASCQKKKTTTEEQDYFFSYQSVKVKIDDDAAPLLKALGEPTEKTESPSCYFGDINDTLYTYPGMEVVTYSKGGVEHLLRLEIVDDSVDRKTPEGIGVGSSRQAVVKAYGEPDSTSSAGAAIYRGKTMTLNFFYSGDTVSRIAYRNNA